jgi:zinc protease
MLQLIIPALSFVLPHAAAMEDVEDPHAWRAEQPAPLAPRPFQVPEASRATLSNGLELVVVENHEAPLVYVDLVFSAGSGADPADAPGLASATLDMLNEGAAGMDAAALSVAQRRLGASISSGAGTDTSRVRIQTLARTLPDSLELFAKVVRQPDFPEASWTILQKKRIQDLKASLDDPNALSARISNRLLYGDQYKGQLRTTTAYEAIDTAAMKDWAARHLRPETGILLVGGDTTLAEIQPLLEAQLGSWQPEGEAAEVAPPTPPAAPDGIRVFLHERPDAPQSVIRISGFVNPRDAAERPALVLANRAWGGQFSARLNMNLREKEGWTYGARSGISDSLLPGLWTASSSVMADATDDAVLRMLDMLEASRTEAPITEDELNYVRTGLLGSWPLAFESPQKLLSEHAEMWRYDLPEDWISGYPARLRAVGLEQANAAWTGTVPADQLTIVVVGDAEALLPGMEERGLEVVRVDADGAPVE